MVSLKDYVCTRRRLLLILGAGVPASYVSSRWVDRSQIPFLITADLHDQPDLYDRLSHAFERLAFLRLKVTIFAPADLTKRTGTASLLRKMVEDGHQVACHGLVHDDSEDYYTDTFEVQFRNLTRAKQGLEDALGTSVTAFRAPEFRISKETINVLEALRFASDLSVCSQRLPWLSSQVGNYHWLFSPRAPYHPSRTNPYVKGDLNLLEIPTSAALLPLMSALNSVSLMATKSVTHVLRYEAAFVRKPIVYQCHLDDFILTKQPRKPMRVSWQSFMPTRHGIPLRWALEETDGNVIYRNNQDFLAFVMQTKAFHFQTVDEYLSLRSIVPRDSATTHTSGEQ